MLTPGNKRAPVTKLANNPPLSNIGRRCGFNFPAWYACSSEGYLPTGTRNKFESICQGNLALAWKMIASPGLLTVGGSSPRSWVAPNGGGSRMRLEPTVGMFRPLEFLRKARVKKKSYGPGMYRLNFFLK